MFFDDGAQLLSEADCQALLAGTNVGRVSLSMGALPVVLPVSYQYLGGTVVIGMRDGRARRAIADGNVIAMGVDNADLAEASWAVLVIGRAAEITDTAERAEIETLGLSLPTGTSVPSHYLRLRPDVITGYGAVIP